MAYELIYTSVPRGLKPGSRGFSTVAFTEGMPANYVQTCEGISGYTHAFQPHDANYSKNPVAFSHYRFRLGGQMFSILSRVAAYGTDYSERSNKLAHHVMASDAERVAAGPAWAMTSPDFFLTAWKQEPHLIKTTRQLHDITVAGCQAELWQRRAGDAGWAGAIAQRFLNTPDKPVFMIFQPGQELLPLVAEVTSLLPRDKRWAFTFSTYFTALPQGTECFLRCCLPTGDGLKMSRRSPDALILDLTGPQQPLMEKGPLIEAARTGMLPAVSIAQVVEKAERLPQEFEKPKQQVIESADRKIRMSYASGVPLAPVRHEHRSLTPYVFAAAAIAVFILGFIGLKFWHARNSTNLRNAVEVVKDTLEHHSSIEQPSISSNAMPRIDTPHATEASNKLAATKSTHTTDRPQPVGTNAISENIATKALTTNDLKHGLWGDYQPGVIGEQKFESPQSHKSNDIVNASAGATVKPRVIMSGFDETAKITNPIASLFFCKNTICIMYNPNGSMLLHNSKPYHYQVGGDRFEINTNNVGVTITKMNITAFAENKTLIPRVIQLQNGQTNLLIVTTNIALQKIHDDSYSCDETCPLPSLLFGMLHAKISVDIGGHEIIIIENKPNVSENTFNTKYRQTDAFTNAINIAQNRGDRKYLKKVLADLSVTNTDIFIYISTNEASAFKTISTDIVSRFSTANMPELQAGIAAVMSDDPDVKNWRKMASNCKTVKEQQVYATKINEFRQPHENRRSGCKTGNATDLRDLIDNLLIERRIYLRKILKEEFIKSIRMKTEKSIDIKPRIVAYRVFTKSFSKDDVLIFAWAANSKAEHAGSEKE